MNIKLLKDWNNLIMSDIKSRAIEWSLVNTDMKSRNYDEFAYTSSSDVTALYNCGKPIYYKWNSEFILRGFVVSEQNYIFAWFEHFINGNQINNEDMFILIGNV